VVALATVAGAVGAAGAFTGRPAAAAEPKPPAGLARATFAGGCFWCMEQPFDKIDGVVSTQSGYTGGQVPKPTYEQVSMGRTGHAEAVQVTYDAAKVRYEQLLYAFWRNVDPFDAGGQFCDRGGQYRPAIFVHDPEQRRLAEASRAELQPRFKDPIKVEIVEAGAFYPAEEYHQDYYLRNTAKYRFYRFSCGRDGRLKQVWGPEAGAGKH
jgi:peptide-methionine (S)-S-oxide reductase